MSFYCWKSYRSNYNNFVSVNFLSENIYDGKNLKRLWSAPVCPELCTYVIWSHEGFYLWLNKASKQNDHNYLMKQNVEKWSWIINVHNDKVRFWKKKNKKIWKFILRHPEEIITRTYLCFIMQVTRNFWTQLFPHCIVSNENERNKVLACISKFYNVSFMSIKILSKTPNMHAPSFSLKTKILSIFCVLCIDM